MQNCRSSRLPGLLPLRSFEVFLEGSQQKFDALKGIFKSVCQALAIAFLKQYSHVFFSNPSHHQATVVILASATTFTQLCPRKPRVVFSQQTLPMLMRRPDITTWVRFLSPKGLKVKRQNDYNFSGWGCKLCVLVEHLTEMYFVVPIVLSVSLKIAPMFEPWNAKNTKGEKKGAKPWCL
jgi:hypothetical protein